MSYATINPATGQTEKTFPAHTPAEVEALLQQAFDTFLEYRTTSFAERARHLINAADLFEGEGPDIARIVTTEMGKTFAAARAEASKCAMGLRWFAEHSEALLADEPIATGASRSVRALPADRPGPGDHAVELPAVAGGALCRTGAHGRQRRPAQARVQRPADGAPPGGHLSPSGPADGRIHQPVHREQGHRRTHRGPADRRRHPHRQREGRHVGRRPRRDTP